MRSKDYGKVGDRYVSGCADGSRDEEYRETQLLEEDIPFIQDELDNVTTILYILIEAVRSDPENLKTARTKIRRCRL